MTADEVTRALTPTCIYPVRDAATILRMSKEWHATHPDLQMGWAIDVLERHDVRLAGERLAARRAA